MFPIFYTMFLFVLQSKKPCGIMGIVQEKKDEKDGCFMYFRWRRVQ